MYQRKTGNALLGKDLTLICPGDRDQGGTPGIYEEFPTLRKILRSDVDQKGKSIRTVVVLIDNDRAGRSLRGALLYQYRDLREYVDLFLLKRVFPRNGQEPWQIAQALKQANASWNALDCEIEDMISPRVLEKFVAENPAKLFRPPTELGGQKHYDFTREGKGRWWETVQAEATLDDMIRLVEALQGLRYYLGLIPTGNIK